MRNLLLTAVAITIALTTANLHAAPSASIGSECKTGFNVPHKYLCQTGKMCLKAIGKMYCSNLGKICGWPGKVGYTLGAKKTYNGKQYECKANGFQLVSSTSGGSSSGGSTTIPIMPTIPAKYRVLTNGEKAILKSVYGNTINFKTIQITDGKGLGGLGWVTQTPIGHLVNLAGDYSSSVTTGPKKWLLVHELAHVWQGQHGVNFMLNSAVNQALSKFQSGNRNGAYIYKPVGKQWRKYNVEQQAYIVQVWFEGGMKKSDELYPYIRDNVRAGKPNAQTKFK